MTHTADQTATSSSRLHPHTVAVHAAGSGNGALAPVMSPASAHSSTTVDLAARKARRPRVSDFYGRYGNPTVQAFADAVGELEGAEAAIASSSGMGAISTVVLALCSQGSHIVTQRQLFSGTAQLFEQVCPRFGIDVTFVDVDDREGWLAAVEPGRTSLVFVESPSNPTLRLADLAAIGSITSATTVVDSTLATPMGQRPLDHGVDLVLHSATKALSGHNDATLGVIAGDKTIINELWAYSTIQGSCASPYDSWNGLRGMKTLAIRHDHQARTTTAVVTALENHPAVATVHYPGSASRAQSDLAGRQLCSIGSCFSFDLVDGYDAAVQVVEGLEVALLAPSLGGPETLVNHPASMTHAAMSDEQRASAGITEGMIRVSVGLEHVEDLLADFDQALNRLTT